MPNSTKITARRRAKKHLRGQTLRRPYLVGIATFAAGLLLDSAADYYFSGFWEWLSALVKSTF